MQPTKEQAQTYNNICYAMYATHFKTVLRPLIKPGEAADEAALRHWNANLPNIQTTWHGLVMGLLTNVAAAQQQGALPPMIETTPAPAAPLPGLGGPIPGPRPETQPAGLATRIAADMRARQDAAKAASPMHPAETPLDVSPGLAIGRDTECEGEHQVVLDAIEAAGRGTDDE